MPWVPLSDQVARYTAARLGVFIRGNVPALCTAIRLCGLPSRFLPQVKKSFTRVPVPKLSLSLKFQVRTLTRHVPEIRMAGSV